MNEKLLEKCNKLSKEIATLKSALEEWETIKDSSDLDLGLELPLSDCVFEELRREATNNLRHRRNDLLEKLKKI